MQPYLKCVNDAFNITLVYSPIVKLKAVLSEIAPKCDVFYVQSNNTIKAISDGNLSTDKRMIFLLYGLHPDLYG